MDLAVIILLFLSSICVVLLALYSFYHVFIERDRKRIPFKIAFPSLLSLILMIAVRRWIFEIDGSTMDNFHAYLIVYIGNLESSLTANLITLSAVALGLPIWISLMKSSLMRGSDGTGLLIIMIRFAETKGQKAIFILMILATVIISSSATLLPRLFIADILLVYSATAIQTLSTIPLLPTIYYLLVLLIKSRRKSTISTSEISQARKEAAKLAIIFVAIVTTVVFWFPMYVMNYLNKPFEDKSDFWYSESNSISGDHFPIAFDWILTAGGFLACFIFRDTPWNWLKQRRTTANTETMGNHTKNFLSLAKDGTLSSAVLKA